jgi:hypothetical protein
MTQRLLAKTKEVKLVPWMNHQKSKKTKIKKMSENLLIL